MKKVVIITGGSSGIGRCAAEYMADKGCRVYEFSRKGESFGAVTHITADVTDEISIRRAVDAVIQTEGRIDVLINNAGFGISGAAEFTTLEEAQKQLGLLNQKAGYMRDLVDSLFELTKVSSGAAESKRETIDMLRLLEQTLGLFDDQLTAANLTVRRHYGTDSILVVTDGAWMHQVFANLLGNAIKYALPGTRIHLEADTTETGCRVRMVNISAYEMNFSPEEILQRFARGDQARTTKGSGLGLAIAQTYTESVGGSFRVEIDGDQFSAIVEL